VKKGEWHHLCRECNNVRLHPPVTVETKEPDPQPSEPIVLFERDPSAPISLDVEHRQAIIILHKAQHTIEDIAHRIPCDLRTVKHWIARYDIAQSLQDLSRSGRPHITDENTNINIAVTARVEKFVTPKKIKRNLDLDTSTRTVRRRLDDAGLYGRVSRKEYPFDPDHIRKRLSFANGYMNWTEEQWATVIYSDECHIELGDHGQVWVQRPVGAAFDYEYMSHKMAHPPRVSVWACFCQSGIGGIEIFTENLDAKLMKDILNKHLIQSAKRLFDKGHWWFLQDNDPKHKSNLVKNWIHNKGVQCLDFPPYSPDLNPIENLWHNLKQRVESHNAQNIDDLQQHIQTEWDATDAYLLANLSNSMRDRCKAVVKAKGHLTDY
jgi:hypothetical protein